MSFLILFYDNYDYRQLCATNIVDMPYLVSVEDLKELIQSTVEISMTSKIHSGASCNGQVIANIKVFNNFFI